MSISFHTLQSCDNLSTPGLKLNHVSEMSPTNITMTFIANHIDIVTFELIPIIK